ncbi:hypothetical protein AOLI_G00066990 [Acnodon oligacanthus]
MATRTCRGDLQRGFPEKTRSLWGAEMWAGLSVALALCVLGGCSAESEPDGARCKAAAEWKIGETEPLKESLGRVTVVAYLQASCLFCLVQASKLDSLRLKLEQLGYANITYMVVNSQDETSRRLHPLLAQRISESITLYGQDPEAPDVWQISNAMKDDFQIYDRCGRLTHHLSLPYTILSEPYVEQAIRSTYCDGICGECTMESSIPQECNTTAEEKPEGETPRAEEEGAGHRHSPGIGLRPALPFSPSPPGGALSPFFRARRAAPARAPPEVEAGRKIRLSVVFTGWSDLLIIKFRAAPRCLRLADGAAGSTPSVFMELPVSLQGRVRRRYHIRKREKMKLGLVLYNLVEPRWAASSLINPL